MMEVRLLDAGYGSDGWLTRPLVEFWKEFSRDFDRPVEQHVVVPAADVVEEADAYHLYFDMPGLKGESVEARIEDGELIVEAERRRPEFSKDAQIHLSECSYGTIRRAMTIPEDASQEGIKASYRDGVLEITMPKKPESRPVKIKVTSED
jgi:HSP20 family protein